MEFITTLTDIITKYGSYILGFFTSFIESVTAQLSAGQVFTAVLLLLIIAIKIRKISG